jgi:hypothetical protein
VVHSACRVDLSRLDSGALQLVPDSLLSIFDSSGVKSSSEGLVVPNGRPR